MDTSLTKLLTIYTEAALESTLIREIDKHGASGYTITNARGKGSSGARTASWEANSNIRVEILCTPELATKLAKALHQKYADNYAMLTYVTNAEIVN